MSESLLVKSKNLPVHVIIFLLYKSFYFLLFRSVRATQAALSCIRKAIHDMQLGSRPRLVLVSDSPSAVKDIKPILEEFVEVIVNHQPSLGFVAESFQL